MHILLFVSDKKSEMRKISASTSLSNFANIISVCDPHQALKSQKTLILGHIYPISSSKWVFLQNCEKSLLPVRSALFFCSIWHIQIFTHMAHIFKNMCHMVADLSTPKNAEKLGGSDCENDIPIF